MSDGPFIVNAEEELNCDICGKSLRGYKGYIASLTRPVDPDKPEGDHEIFKAIHIDCYKHKNS